MVEDAPKPQVVLSLVPVQGGGAGTVALTTATTIVRDPDLSRRIQLVARRSLITQLDPSVRSSVTAVSDRRLVAEFQLRRIARSSAARWAVSIFGPAAVLVSTARRATVFSYANAFHPDVDYWPSERCRDRIAGKLRDRLRMYFVNKSDVIFFETPLLRSQAKDLMKRQDRSLRVLAPSRDSELERELAAAPASRRHGRFSVLLFSDYRPHKRWDVLPDVVAELSRRGVEVDLLLTSDEASEIVEGTSGGSARIRQIGPVPFARRAAVLADADALLLVSQVESFSNNYYEAWAAEIPLIVSDAHWSRAALGDAALYVDPTSPKAIADGIESAMAPHVRSALQQRGGECLQQMPTPAERLTRMLDELSA